MIQLYEQKQYELAKAQAGIVLDLAKVLGCDAADLILSLIHIYISMKIVIVSQRGQKP